MPLKIGNCTGIVQEGGFVTIKDLAIFKEAGFDYIELPLTPIAALDSAGFEGLRHMLSDSNIPCEVCNVFLPGALKIVGADVNMNDIERYISQALTRAEELGVGTVVFGSGASRNIPDNFSLEEARKQLIWFLSAVSEQASAHNIDIAIENLNKGECNILNYVSECAELSLAAGKPNIQILADYYHMKLVDEDMSAIIKVREAGVKLIHTHIADPLRGRLYPLIEQEYEDFFKALGHIGYCERLSIEGGTNNIEQDCKTALNALHSLAKKYLS